jgi:hypothetical protein
MQHSTRAVRGQQRRGRARRWRAHPGIALVLSVLLATPLLALPAAASHFRSGNYTWVNVSGNTVDFNVQNAFRRSGYTSCYIPSSASFGACTGPGGEAGVGDIISEEIGATTFSFGDGTTASGPGGALLYKVTSIDVTDDWLLGLALDDTKLPNVVTTLRHTYASAGTVTAFTSSCCRIGPPALINNAGGEYRVETTVNVGGTNHPPVSSLPPVVHCPVNGNCQFQVPASDLDGDTIGFRLSTAAEAGNGSFTQPGPPYATNAASINGTTGIFTWNTNGATVNATGPTYYSAQVTIEDHAATGAVKSKIAVDFLIQLSTQTGNPPAFVSPTPTCNSTINATVGNNVSFTVKASDPDVSDTVTLNAVGLPAGSQTTPVLPTGGNPVQTAFSWTPTSNGSAVVTFSATDDAQHQALCSITIAVGSTAERVPPSCELTAVVNGPPKAIQVTVQDAGTGLASVGVVTHNNAIVTVPAFTSGTTTKVVVTGTKSNQALASQVALQVKDVAGNVTNCDPVLATLRPGNNDVSAGGLFAEEHLVKIDNGRDGLDSVHVVMNGEPFTVPLQPGETRLLDVASAMRPGDSNQVRITGSGAGHAEVLVWDGS